MFLYSVHQTIFLILSILQLTTAAESKPPEPCTMHNVALGSSYDLRPLQLTPIDWTKPLKSQATSATNESYHVRGYDYPYNFTMNFCGPAIEAANLTDVEGITTKQVANISAYYKDKSGDIYSLGFANTEPIFRGRKLVLNYTHGSPCPEIDEDGDIIKKRSPKIIDGDSKTQKTATRRKATLLSFICDTAPSLTNRPSVSFLGTLDHCTYVFEVRSRWACPGATPSKESGTLGPGAVFAVILLIAIAVYIVGGVVYQRNVMHQRGWRQLPNYSVWAGIFGFVSDMFIIVFSSCSRCLPGLTGLFGKGAGYHRVGDYSRVSGPNGTIGRNRTPEDENRLIDQLDEEWD